MSSFVKQVEEEANRVYSQNRLSLAEPRLVFSRALETRFNDLKRVSSGKEKKEYESDICRLFVSRAAMEINAKQHKQAKLVFDEAFKHDFCERSSIVWIAYINFYIREKKTDLSRKHLREAVDTVDVIFNMYFYVAGQSSRDLGVLGSI